MNLFNIPQDTIVRSPGAPRFFPGNRDAVLILHGYIGHTGELAYLAERINEAGYTVFIPRLPGHGTNGEDFAQTNASDWLRCAVDSYLELQRTYNRVAVCGLSMGGLLALLLAARFRPAAAVALAPALAVSNPLFSLTPVLRLVIKRFPKPYDPPEDDDPELRFLHEQYWRYHWVEQIAGIHRLARRTRNSLPRVNSPTLTIVSTADRTVPARVAEIVARGISAEANEQVRLSESGHVLSNDVERERVADLAVSWLQRHMS